MTPSDESPRTKPDRSTPQQDHTLDPASPKVHPDARADGVGASGTVKRALPDKPSQPEHVDHGIDQVMTEPHRLNKDRRGEEADSEAHKDDGVVEPGLLARCTVSACGAYK